MGVFKPVVLAVMLLGSVFAAAAQSHEEDPRFGDTPEQRLENVRKYRLLRELVENGECDIAAAYVKDLMDEIPSVSPNLYILGATAYKNRLEKTEDPEMRAIYLDSILLIYDRRAEYFGGDANRGRPYILRMKALDYRALAGTDTAGILKYFREAVDAETESVPPDFALVYMRELADGYAEGNVEAEAFFGEYERLLPAMASADEWQKNEFHSLMASAVAESCEAAEAFYAPLLAASPDDTELAERLCRMMSATPCDSDFYIGLAEKVYKENPSSEAALRIASACESRQMYSKALEYLHPAAAAENDPVAKTKLYVRIAVSELGADRPQSAAWAAASATELSPSDGAAHTLLAEAYIAGTGDCDCGTFQASTVFWLAYDELQRAHEAFAGDSRRLDAIGARMTFCAENFPTFEEGFMNVRDYQDGDVYTVQCGWISGETTIRSR